MHYVAEAHRLWHSFLFGLVLSRDGTLLMDGDYVYVMQDAPLRLGPSGLSGLFGPPPQRFWKVDYFTAFEREQSILAAMAWEGVSIFSGDLLGPHGRVALATAHLQRRFRHRLKKEEQQQWLFELTPARGNSHAIFWHVGILLNMLEYILPLRGSYNRKPFFLQLVSVAFAP